MKYFTKEVKIALVAIVGIIVLFLGMNFLKGLNLFTSDNRYYISFKDISGLSSSCPIYADGYKVGVVRSIDYNYGEAKDIIVEADIDKNMRIPKGSSAEIVSDLMGNVKSQSGRNDSWRYQRRCHGTGKRPYTGSRENASET